MQAPDLRTLHTLLESGKTSRVIAELESAITVDPAHTACYALLATAHEAAGHEAEAIRWWKQAWALCPDSPAIADRLRAAARKAALDAASDAFEGSGLMAGFPDPGDTGHQDLDRLIRDLESARIVPDPQVEIVGEDALEVDVEDVVSETLARIYANQRFFAEAADVYDKLSVQHPDRKTQFESKAAEMRAQAGR